MVLSRSFVALAVFATFAARCIAADTVPPTAIPTSAEAIAAKTDVWGDLASKQPSGPTYDFFAKLLPPLRYVDAWFRDYPIVLSAPGATIKARFISNGSIINALARQPSYLTEVGTPIRVYVGPERLPFGADPARTAGPHYERGYLPVVNVSYRVDGARYTEEAFAATEPALADHGVLYLRITLDEGDTGKVELQIEGTEPFASDKGAIHDKAGRIYLCAEPKWKLKRSLNSVMVTLIKGESAVVAIPADGTCPAIPIDSAAYDAAHKLATETWQKLVDQSMQVTVSEPVVNNAWRALICGSYALLKGDVICYSAANQYSHLYESEGGDAAKSLLMWGHHDDGRRMIVPLLNFTRAGLEYHQAGLKLQLLATYYWLTGDAEFIREQTPKWQKEVDRIINGREKDSGLLPREKYAGDIETRVYSLNSNANCWRGLHDMAAVLDSIGQHDAAQRIGGEAAAFRKVVLAAVEKSEQRDVQPHFVPMALLGDEKAYDVVTATRPGSYYDLMIPYVLSSGVLAYDSEPETAIIQYLQQHGGISMGMIRTGAEPGFWINPSNLDDLYGIRYELALFERDDVDRLLVSFYGKLAQGFTRDTFIGAEGTCLTPLDAFGRQMYLPPNSASNAHFLYLLRYTLMQDWDLNDDGKPDTLRLLFTTPRQWLADGHQIKVERAPTAFGELSMTVRSHLNQGNVSVDLALPDKTPEKTLLRLRLPDNYRIKSASVTGGVSLPPRPDETLDLSSLRGKLHLDVQVAPAP